MQHIVWKMQKTQLCCLILRASCMPGNASNHNLHLSLFSEKDEYPLSTTCTLELPFILFCSAGDLTQGLTHANQVLYYWFTSPPLISFKYRWKLHCIYWWACTYKYTDGTLANTRSDKPLVEKAGLLVTSYITVSILNILYTESLFLLTPL
jgi:hypothetical protein